MSDALTTPDETQIDQICSIWDSGWHEAHAGIVPPALTKLRTTKSFFDRTREHLGNTRIATAGRKVIGFCMVKDDELYQMYLSRDARGTGVAQALIRDAENRIFTAGHNTAWLACAVGNERASRFYERAGWFNTGQQPVHLDTSEGTFSLDVWRFEKSAPVC